MSDRAKILHLEDDDRDAELVEAALQADGVELEILRATDASTFELHLARRDLARRGRSDCRCGGRARVGDGGVRDRR